VREGRKGKKGVRKRRKRGRRAVAIYPQSYYPLSKRVKGGKGKSSEGGKRTSLSIHLFLEGEKRKLWEKGEEGAQLTVPSTCSKPGGRKREGRKKEVRKRGEGKNQRQQPGAPS